MLFLYFSLLAAVIIFAGKYLTIYSEIVAAKTKLGSTLMGVIFVALITSLPEMVTSIKSSLLGAPQMAVGNVFGSNMFNLFIIAFLQMILGVAIIKKISKKFIFQGAMAIIITFPFLFSLILRFAMGDQFAPWLYALPIGIETIIIILIYILSLKKIFGIEQEEFQHEVEESGEKYKDMSLSKSIALFVLLSVVIVTASTFLTIVADKISAIKVGGVALGHNFVGMLFLAFATSLPELIVSYTALKMGNIDLMMGDLLGSNLFNVIVLFFADIAFIKAPITTVISPLLLIPIIISVLFEILIIYAIFSNKEKRLEKRFNYITIIMVFFYILANFLLFAGRGSL